MGGAGVSIFAASRSQSWASSPGPEREKAVWDFRAISLYSKSLGNRGERLINRSSGDPDRIPTYMIVVCGLGLLAPIVQHFRGRISFSSEFLRGSKMCRVLRRRIVLLGPMWHAILPVCRHGRGRGHSETFGSVGREPLRSRHLVRVGCNARMPSISSAKREGRHARDFYIPR